eukprot:jgi/Psemu1/9520/gm1.9520_g
MAEAGAVQNFMRVVVGEGGANPSAYPVRKPLYEAHSMTYNSPAVGITKQHRDAIKIRLYQLHATLLIANWLYDDVT